MLTGRQARIRSFFAILASVLAAVAFTAAQAGAQEPAPSWVGEVESLSPEQREQVAEAFSTIVGSLGDLGDMPKLDLPSFTGPLPSLDLPSLDGALPSLPAGPGTSAVPGLPDLPIDLPLPPEVQGLVDQVSTALEVATFTWEADCAGRKTSAVGVLFVPTPLDVCGNALPDVLATLTVTPTGGQMTIAKLPLAGAVPAKIEAVLDDPRDTAARGAAFGYDASGSSAPANFTATLALTGTQQATTVGLDLTMTGAGPTLAVIGEAFEKGAAGARSKPQRARLGYAPVPASSSLTVRTAGSDASATLGAATPTVTTLTAEDLSGATARRVDARIDRLPGSLTIALAGSNVSYRASGPVDSITAGFEETQGASVLQDIELELGSLPTEIDVNRPTATRTTVTTNGPIGSVFAGVAKGGAPQRRIEPAYLSALRTASTESLAVRVLGLESATFDSGQTTSLGATLLPGPFALAIHDGARKLDGSIADLPRTFALDFDPATRHASYTGSSPIDLLTIAISDPGELAPRVTNLDLVLRGIPTQLELGLGQDGDALGADALGAQVGLVEARLHDGTPALTLLDSEDGLKMRDVATDYEVFARISGLRKVLVAQRPVIDFQLDVAGGRVFVIDLVQRQATGPDQTVTGRIDKIAPDTSVRLFEEPNGVRKLVYNASAGTDRIDLAATGVAMSGRADRAELLLQALPTSMTLELPTETSSRVLLDAGTGLGFARALITSGPGTTLGEDGIKLIDTAAQYTVLGQITNLRRISVQQRPSIALEVGTAGGRPFTADLRQRQASGPDQTAFARIVNLPATVAVGFAEAAGRRKLTYTGSSVVTQVILNADNLPLSGRARLLRMTLDGVPAALTLDLGAEGGNVDMTTGGAALGRVDAVLTSGPIESVPAGFDGLLSKNLPDRYVIAARVSGLVRATAAQSPLSLFLDSTAGNPARVRIESQPSASAKNTFTEATLSNLRRNTTVSLNDAGGRTQVSYSAAATTGSLVLATNSGDRPRLDASLAPVPTALGICFAPGNDGCAAGRPSNKVSALLTASSTTTVNLLDQGASKLEINDLSLRRLQTAINTSPVCVPFFGCGADGANGSIFLDTDNLPLRGEVKSDTGSVKLRAFFPNGFTANDRFRRWSAGVPVESGGSVNCPSGTALDVTLFGITINVAGLYLC